jgi:hypothetical protein
MDKLMQPHAYIPKTSKGLHRVVRSLHATRCPVIRMDNEPEWTSSHVSERCPWKTQTLLDFGYGAERIRAWHGRPDRSAMINPMQLLTQEGSSILAGICRQLEAHAQTNDYVVTRRLRRVQDSSTFVFRMIRDRSFLHRVSSAVGVPLIPHPYSDASVQINYYYPPDPAKSRSDDVRIAKWHVDGMDYVFTMLLTPPSEFEGGEFLYFRGPKEQFDPDTSPTERGNLAQVGDTLFTRGSHLFHCVTPVTRGLRITLVISLFCPYFAQHDGNRFWHSAPDDGFGHVLRTWLRYKRWGISADSYSRMVSAPLVGWDEIGSY